MKYLSLFSGIGGFELGIKQAYVDLINRSKNRGKQKDKERDDEKRARLVSKEREDFGTSERYPSEYSKHRADSWKPDCVGFSEIDKYAIQIYQKQFPEHKNYGDITKIKPEELPDFDFLVGGFPCQSFSIAGKRGGFNDTRGTLFFEIARIIKVKQPSLLLLENVKGLLSHEKGRTFRTIISTLDELGYDLQWQVLNSKNFGVPQNRERVFIVGHLRGTARPEVFPIGESHQELTGKADKQGCANTLTGKSAGGQNRRGNYIKQLNKPKHSNDRIYGKDGIEPTLNTAQGGRRQPKIPEGENIRRLTPLECERLQGFPDNWTQGVSDTQRYKTLGNAVTVNVIKEIIKTLFK